MTKYSPTLPDKYPAFYKFVQNVFLKSPLQEKRIMKHLARRDTIFWGRAEEFAEAFIKYSAGEKTGITPEDAIDTYLKMCADMLIEQIQFQRTGKYSCASAKQAYTDIYSSDNVMTSYMYGLALSFFLWSNHYDIYDFFVREIEAFGGMVQKYLEIGAGHGLFLSRAIDTFRKADFTVVDISETSISISGKIIRYLSRRPAEVHFRHMDVMSFKDSSTFDFISMGEVLEHVEDPGSLMRKIRGLLNPQGRAFISTCCNCPAIDHIYLFRNVKEIHDLFRDTGIHIDNEIILPVEGPREDIDKYKQIPINYAAIISRSNI